jgi:hypothetical protein
MLVGGYRREVSCRPKGPKVLPALGNAWGYGIITFRLGPLPLKIYGGYDPQGVALGLENGWAFGPKLLSA